MHRRPAAVTPDAWTPWTWLGWLEAVAALHALLDTADHLPLEVCPTTGGLITTVGGVRVTVHGAHTLHAAEHAGQRAGILGDRAQASLQAALTTPDVVAILTDAPEQGLASLDDALAFPQYGGHDPPDHVVLDTAQRRKVLAMQAHAVKRLADATAARRRVSATLTPLAAVGSGAAIAFFLLPNTVMRMVAALVVAVCLHQASVTYNRHLGGVHVIRKMERDVRAGLRALGFTP